MKQKLFIIVSFCVLILLVFVVASQYRKIPKAGFIAEESSAVTYKMQASGNGVVTIDFGSCDRGSTSISFGFGSTHFAFEGIKRSTCHFYMGTEIENPNWDGSLSTECFVPTSLGKSSFIVNNYGLQTKELIEYCTTR